MSPEQLRGALAKAGLDGALTDDDLADLARVATVRSFGRGFVLWRAGAASRGLFVVLSGQVRVVRSRRGRQHLLHVSGPGATMGEVPLSGGGGYPATAIVSRDAECLVLPVQDVLDIVARNTALANLLLRQVCRRVEGLATRLEAQTLGDVRTRLAASLVGLAAESPNGTIQVPRPQSEWAEDLGTVREVLARELKSLETRGLIERDNRRHLRILDEDQLEAIALGADST